MGPEAGWYVDPDESSRLRFWDGQAWSSHTHSAAPTVTMPSPPNPWANHDAVGHPSMMPPPQSGASALGRRIPTRIVIGAIVAAAALAAAVGLRVVGISGAPHAATSSRAPLPVPTNAPPAANGYPAGCITPTPPGISAAPAGYVLALNEAAPAWTYTDQSYRAKGLFDVSALRAQADGDATFVKELKSIAFPAGAAQATAQRLIVAVDQYREVVLQAAADPSHANRLEGQLGPLEHAREQASVALRGVLGLPNATCNYDRPS